MDLTKEQVFTYMVEHPDEAYEFQEAHAVSGPWVVLVIASRGYTPRYVRMARGEVVCQAYPVAPGLWQWGVNPSEGHVRPTGGHARSEDEAKALCERALRARGVLLA